MSIPNARQLRQRARRAPGRLGFSLLELAVVLVIAALVTGGILAMIPKYTEKTQRDETTAKQALIQQRLLEYRRAFNRLPCPADITLNNNTAGFGVEGVNKGSCTSGTPAANFVASGIANGMVPTKTLQLPDEYAFDGWGRRFFYAVDIRFTSDSAFTNLDIYTNGDLKILDANDQVLGALPVSAGVQATFAGIDASTSGNWIGHYGSDGYHIFNDAVSYPGYVTVSNSGVSAGNWTGSTTEARGLIKATDNNDRIAPYWTNTAINPGLGSYTFDVDLTDGVTHSVTLYGVDWDGYGGGRSEKVEVLNASNNAVLDTQNFTAFGNGKYIRWNIQGHVIFKVTCTNAASNAVLSGLFFDPVTGTTVYALVSPGANGHGGYTRQGGVSRMNAKSTNAHELKNCHCDSNGATTAFDNAFYQQSFAGVADSINQFDDIVVSANRSALRGYAE